MTDEVIIVKTQPEYPEFPYDDESQPMYRSLRGLFKAWGKDPDNPFGGLVESGGVVVIKPNWVVHRNPRGYGIESLVTHSALIKYVIDWSAKALGKRGKIVIGDAPIQGCDFARLMELARMKELLELARERYPDISFELEDWRLTVLCDDILRKAGEPAQKKRADYAELIDKNYVLVDLGKESFLEELADYYADFRVMDYDKDMMLSHHHPGKHEYLITKRICEADLVVSLAKMKTHMKAGLTGALKNLVGINGHKEFLPHHIKGGYPKGGDAYAGAHFLRRLHDALSDLIWVRYMNMSTMTRKMLSYCLDLLRWGSILAGGESTSMGSWSSNETLWRTVLDLNHIFYFSEHSPKKAVTIVDGIIAGEGQGPLKPRPKPAGILIAGENPAYIDAVIAKLLGYNISRIPVVYNAIYNRKSKLAGPFLSDFKIVSMLEADLAKQITIDELPDLNFKKPRFWGHAEARKQKAGA